MDIIDNFKKVGQNWRLATLVIWLLVGVAIIPYPNGIVSTIGILIFLPFLVFLMFLFLLSLISKKSIFEYPTWKVILFLLVSLPIMLLISIVLIVMFAVSIITYFFFTSWFIFYACYLIGRKIDNKLASDGKKKRFLRVLIFFGGLAASLSLLYLFVIGPTIFDFNSILETPSSDPVPWYLNAIYFVVGGVLIGLAVVCVVYMFKKRINGWFGIFSILVSIYTLFLVLKIYLGLVGTEAKPEDQYSIWAYMGIIIPDLIIIFYSLSTLMGSQAELLNKRVKRFGIDTVIIWLILSKVTYEFIHYFPYDILKNVSISWIPWISELSYLNDRFINNVKNIAVLAFFILVLVVFGMYEIYKYHRVRKEPIEEELEEENEVFLPEPNIYEPQSTMEQDSLDTSDYEEKNGDTIENRNRDI